MGCDEFFDNILSSFKEDVNMRNLTPLYLMLTKYSSKVLITSATMPKSLLDLINRIRDENKLCTIKKDNDDVAPVQLGSGMAIFDNEGRRYQWSEDFWHTINQGRSLVTQFANDPCVVSMLLKNGDNTQTKLAASRCI